MKRKRGCGRRKPKMPPVVGVSLNIQDDSFLDDYYNAEFDSRMETETPQNERNDIRQQAADLSKKDKIIMTKSSRGLASSSIKPSSNPELVKVGKTHHKDPKLPDQDPLYKGQELKAALMVVRKVMKMDAAVPFNVPVDPIALGVPDYFDVIHTPMDFGTICCNLEHGVKYKNCKEVFRDVQYIWDNCSKHNNEGHYTLELMKRVKKNFTKYWTEAGLPREQLQEINGHSHVPPVESTMRCSTHDHWSPMGPMTECPRLQQQDQTDLSQCQPHQLSRSYRMSYQTQQRRCEFQLSSGQQQTSHTQAGKNIGSAGHSHLNPIEATVRWSPYGHRFPVGPNANNSTHWRQNQTGLSQPQLHQHQPSSDYSQSSQPQQGSCQWQPSSGQPQASHPHAGTYIDSAGVSHLPPRKFTVRRSPRGHRCPVDLMVDNPTHLQQNQTGASQPQLHQHQPSLSCSQPSQPQQRSSTCQRSFGQPQPSQPHAGTDLANTGHLGSPPPAETMIRCSKCGPRCPMGAMTDYSSHEQQDQIAPSQMLLHRPSVSYGQPNQVQQGTCLVQLNSSQPQPSQPQAGMEMGRARRVCSPPPVEPMVRCSKRGPRCPVGPMTDYASHEQQEQMAPSQMLLHQSSASHGQPHHPQQGIFQVQLSCSQPQPSQPQTGTDMGSADSSSIRRRTRGRGPTRGCGPTRGRGPTRCLNVWNREGKISIPTNELWQPIGLEAPKLTNFLGTIARNGHIAPLNYVDWRALPDANKEKMWQHVQSKFDINPKSKRWVLKSISKKWKDWKAELKANHYNIHETDEMRLADRDERVLPDQWRILISFWNSKEARDRSVTNKANRAQQKLSHTTGTKSFARVREEQRTKRTDGKEPSRAELFIMTRTRKNGRPVNEASSLLISQLRELAAQQQETSQNGTVKDDIFSQVMGQDRHGRVRTYGLGPSPSDLRGPTPSRAEAMRMFYESRSELRDMIVRMVTIEQTFTQMTAQLATMMSMMSNMQKFPYEHGSLSEPFCARRVADISSNSEGLPQLQVHPSSFVQGGPSRQRDAMKRGRAQNTSITKVSHKRS